MRRSRLSHALIVYVSTVSAAAAAVDPETFFTSLCTDEEATGLSWKGDGWTEASFTSSSYYIEKRSPVEDAQCGEEMEMKRGYDDPSRLDFDPYSFTYGCYNLRGFAAQFNPVYDKVCRESWYAANGKKSLTRVDCIDGFEIISFAPTGNYNYARISSQIMDNPPNGRKASLVVSAGKCKVVM